MNSRLTWVLVLSIAACGDDAAGVTTDAEFQAACENGVLRCDGDPMWGLVYGGQDCSPAAIAAAYQGCDDACREGAAPIIDCQTIATTCDDFAACAQP
jgi:hypothetical protein